MRKFNPTKADLSEHPETPENLLRGFQGRPVRKSTGAVLPIQSLKDAQLLGRSNVIFYQSDKRDPKDPKGEGQQGYVKRFYHDQNPESYLYVISQTGDIDSFQSELIGKSIAIAQKLRKSSKKLYPRGPLPNKIVELADLEKVDLSIGKQEYELNFVGYKLYVWDNMKTLMALPISNGQITDSCIYIWCSNHTKVNWRGIID
tara:strand:+ start:1238 stop:1843 length:606 start_codon:yes stop_codon:yes gene_type:complete